MTLTVRIEPDSSVVGWGGLKQPLAAYVVQAGVHGDNLLSGRNVRDVDEAKRIAESKLAMKIRCRIEWDVRSGR